MTRCAKCGKSVGDKEPLQNNMCEGCFSQFQSSQVVVGVFWLLIAGAFFAVVIYGMFQVL